MGGVGGGGGGAGRGSGEGPKDVKRRVSIGTDRSDQRVSTQTKHQYVATVQDLYNTQPSSFYSINR